MDAHALKQAVAKEAINRVESHQGNDIILGLALGARQRASSQSYRNYATE